MAESTETVTLPSPAGMRLLKWLDSGDTGLSSRALAAAANADPAVERFRKIADADCPRAYPSDSGDFGRCVRLLEAVPELRETMHRAAKLSPVWWWILKEWDELETLHWNGSGRLVTERIRRITGKGVAP